MILEVAVLNVRPGQEKAFEQAMAKARPLIAASPGFGSIEVRRCVEVGSRYLLHHFYDPFPVVEHYGEPVVS